EGVRQHLAPGEVTKNGNCQGNRRIKVGSGNLPGNVNAHRDSQSPSQSDIGVAAVDHFGRVAGGKEYHHGDNAGSKQDQHERSEKLGKQLRDESAFFVHYSAPVSNFKAPSSLAMNILRGNCISSTPPAGDRNRTLPSWAQRQPRFR